MVIFAVLMFAISGCSVFISTPRVAHIRIHDLDNKFIEYIVDLDNPTERDVGIHLSNKYTLQLDFEWLWNMDKRTEIYAEQVTDSEESKLTPWMLCKYRF